MYWLQSTLSPSLTHRSLVYYTGRSCESIYWRDYS